VNLSSGPAVQGILSQAQVRERQVYAIQKNIETLRNRVNELGVSEPIVQRQGNDRINVQLPGVQNSAEVKDVLGKVATLEWRLTDMQNNPLEAQRRGRAPLGSKLYLMRETKQPVLLKRDIIVTGDQLTDAKSVPTQDGPGVSIKLDARGGDEMLKTTSANVGRRMGGCSRRREPVIVDGKPHGRWQAGDSRSHHAGVSATPSAVSSVTRSRSPACAPVRRATLRCCCGPARWPRPFT
jgi:preprotein translocase subunit SecD